MKKLTLGTLLAALAASAILAAPGGAAKPAYSITCTEGTGGVTTLTWISGTTAYSGEWRSADNTQTGLFESTGPLGNGPGSTTLDTPTVAATASVTFTGRKVGARLQPVNCVPV